MSDKDSQSPKLIFLHIPKTGGTAIEEYIANSSEYNTIAPFTGYDDCGNKIDFKKFWEKNAKTPFIFGHFNFSQLPPPQPSTEVFTFLRDPIERCISQYHSWSRFSENDQHVANASEGLRQALELSRELAPDDWFLSDHPEIVGTIRNLQTRYLASAKTEGDQMLETAKINLLSISTFGLLEEFSASVENLRAIVPSLPEYRVPPERENRTSGRLSKTDLSSAALNRLTALNKLDKRLYEFALSRFAGP